MSSLIPLYVPRLPRQRQAVAQAPAQEQPVYDKAPQRPAPEIPTTDAKTLAAQITAAGARRRAEIPDRGAEPTHPVARAIIRAAAMARAAPTAPDLPEHPVARAICLCGQKKRGVIGASGERFLSDFIGKLEATRGLLR